MLLLSVRYLIQTMMCITIPYLEIPLTPISFAMDRFPT